MTYIVLNAVPVFTGPAVHLNDMPLDCTQGCTQFGFHVKPASKYLQRSRWDFAVSIAD